jgi:hypothetical protein
MRIGYLVGGRRILPSFLTLIAAASMPLLSERYLKFSLLLALHLQSLFLHRYSQQQHFLSASLFSTIIPSYVLLWL